MTRQQETVARISYQKFFRRYLHLCGMTGTAREVAGELWSVYGLPVFRIPTHRPLRRKALPDRIFPCRSERDAFLLDCVRGLREKGQPVLIGTASVAASEGASRLLASAGLEHRVLNAKNDAEEAGIVAQAGEAGAVTIATNMAGRGTDIKLAHGVAELGGLHVILTELHEAARIDRQLFGRCARQGDPGTFQSLLHLDESGAAGGRMGLAGFLLRRLAPMEGRFWSVLAKGALLRLQRETERYHERLRRDLFLQDVRKRNQISFLQREE